MYYSNNSFAKTLVTLAFFLLSITYAQNFRTIPLPDPTERVTGIYCTSATACVVATDGTGGVSHIYATDGQTITATLITGDGTFSEPIGTLGGVDFVGFSKVGDTLIAHMDLAGTGFVSATGDITQASSWSAVKIGSVDDENGLGLNTQMGFGQKDGHWVYFTHRKTYESTDAPGANAFWTSLWSPMGVPTTPDNFQELYSADATLCAAEPGISITPKLTQPAYVAPDLSVIVYPAGSRNQTSEVAPGVCISTDGGKLYHHVAFPELSGDLGPMGVHCISSSKCFAYGGLEYEADSVYVYYSNDSDKGVSSSWTRATLPTTRDNTRFRSIAFAPDGVAGWLVGADGSSSPLLFTTTDGGATWTDATSLIREYADGNRLHSVYVFDNEHVWIGGENGTLLTTGK